MIDVNMNYFRAAAECQSNEETRYYLKGVYVAPHPEKGVLLTATDGHRLITLHDETGKCSAPKIVKIDPKAIDAKTYNALLKSMSIEEAPRMDARDEVSSDIRDVFAEAKSGGFDLPALRAIVRTQREDAEKRKNREAFIDLYRGELGID